MERLPAALNALANYPQFIIWKLVATPCAKPKKLPVDHRTLQVFKKGEDWQQDPQAWTSAHHAIGLCKVLGSEFGVGFLFTKNDPFYFVDIDNCLHNDAWSPVAVDIMGRLPGAAIEVSQSGQGLHIIGRGRVPEHSCKNIPLGVELYTEGRFVALTGTNAVGDANIDSTPYMPTLVSTYFAPKQVNTPDTWTTEPVANSNPPVTDEELVAKAMQAQSAASAFNGTSTFAALWTNDIERLVESYPSDTDDYDRSSADAALAQHLAFWTGNNCQRMLALMWKSGLVRDKWHEREGYYLERTVLHAVSLQTSFYTGGQEANEQGFALAEQYGAGKIRASSEAQRSYTENVRAKRLIECNGDESLLTELCSSNPMVAQAKFWLDGQDKTVQELVQSVKPVEAAADPFGDASGPEIVVGHQYLGATLQLEHFAGCVYIQNIHRVFTPSGALLKSEQFNATYGGYIFQLDETGNKTTRKAWEAFTESQIVRWPKAESICFRPAYEPGTMLIENERKLVNTYVPVKTTSIPGDVTPFLTHLSKVLPNELDRSILLAYMAACVQHKGVKFQWTPLIQGAEGNGKTLFTRCVAFAMGKQYVHYPKANDIDSKFNGWLQNKLFIGVEDIYVPDHKREVIETLKPMITNDEIEIQGKGSDQYTGDNYANFILNTNHKDALRKTHSDRRFAIFYTAQQNYEDIENDGMTGSYFPDLYDWLKDDGYAKVNHFLEMYQIPDELNPATKCHRAPKTSVTEEAIQASMGTVEQEITEAIEENRTGFAGGWISSLAVEKLLKFIGKSGNVSHNKRREILNTMGYYWHPALNKGRVNNHITVDDGKPRLYIKKGHPDINLTTAADVARAYQDAQGPVVSEAQRVFG